MAGQPMTSWTTAGLPHDWVPTDLDRLYQRLNAEYLDGALADVPVYAGSPRMRLRIGTVFVAGMPAYA